MELRKWLEGWDMASLKINAKFLKMEWHPQSADQDAAWDLYAEMLTRIATQPLPAADYSDEKSALDSVYELFPLTRNIIRNHGRDCSEFTKIAIVILNQIVRPFTTKWHRLSLQGAFTNAQQKETFRKELSELQVQLKKYTQMLADMAGIEDLTELEEG